MYSLIISGPVTLQKIQERLSLGAKHLKSMLRRLGFIVRRGGLSVLGQGSDLLNVMVEQD